MHPPPDPHFGPGSTYSVVVPDRLDPRSWMRGAPLSPLLSEEGIAHCGWVETPGGLEVARHRPDGSYVMVTLGGEGEVRIDGGWRKVGPDHVVLLPPLTPNAFRAREGSWSFCWVRYRENTGRTPVVSMDSPVYRMAGSRGLFHAVAGLHDACSRTPDPVAQRMWVDAVTLQVRLLARPAGRDSRLERLWQTVSADLAHPWTLGELADLAHVSPEHLRRLCRRDLGRSPMQQLIYLRMRAAQALLVRSTDPIETVCRAVGYTQPFTFSNTFQKWMGVRPSAIRPK